MFLHRTCLTLKTRGGMKSVANFLKTSLNSDLNLKKNIVAKRNEFTNL